MVGKGTLNVPGLPRLTDVWLVEGLKANLMNIRQLCDQKLFVWFNKNKCLVIDKSKTCVMKGVRSTDNCYLLIPPATCLKTKAVEAKLGIKGFAI